MITRYKRAPGWTKSPVTWISIIGIATLAIVLVSYFSYAAAIGQEQQQQKTKTGTMIDFETDSYKSILKVQSAKYPYVTPKGGSKAFVLNGSAFYAFAFPKITNGVFAGRTFGFTLYKQDVGDFGYSIFFGTRILTNGQGGLYPESKGVIVTISRDFDTISILHAVAGSFSYSSVFYAENKTVFHGPEKMVFSFTMLTETSFKAKINGHDILRGATSSYWNTTFSDFEYLATYQFSTGNTPSTIWGYLDDLHVSWA